MKKILGWTFIIIINYFLIFFLLYIFSSILLVKNITPSNSLVREYQRNYYIMAFRNIWQSQADCIEFSKSQIYKPKETTCDFDNVEFKTKTSFDKFGRVSDHPKNIDSNGIAVIGDSFAMGWGVNDKETFSYLLEKKINRPVYNLAVSGYGTVRELIRLEESNLIDKVDTIILQYCYNDHGENYGYKKTSLAISKSKYNLVKKASKMSFWKKTRKMFRYSITIPINILTKKNKSISFEHHRETLIEVLKKFEFIKDKRIIVFYTNGHQQRFSNFPSGKSKNFNKLEYIDLKIENKLSYFYPIDGHLNKTGHAKIAEHLSKLF